MSKRNLKQRTVLKGLKEKLVPYYKWIISTSSELNKPVNLIAAARYCYKTIHIDVSGHSVYDKYEGAKVERYIKTMWRMGTFRHLTPDESSFYRDYCGR